ncbi:MFS transporter [Arthrobacter sp. NPDC093139]|uniref:MFS transporter n=1 Tax=Arthrobacter sp. NPDC093139 TaxID=3363945 RepID=UPI0037F1E81C
MNTSTAARTSRAEATGAGDAPARVEPSPRLLLASQLIFNIGFFSVVPFLAVTMREDFGMGAMAIGIVLGARTFAQQGLFLFGGAIADVWGARRAMITGCLVRIAGYLLLVLAQDFPLFLLGAVVTGVGGALFSPALESLVAAAAQRGTSRSKTAPNSSTKGNQSSALFALLVVFGEVGAVVGPLLGALLLDTGFDTALLSGAGVFALMALVFLRFLPKTRPASSKAPAEQSAPPSGIWSCFGEKKFIWFAAFYSVNLLAYNQLYFGLPVELQRSGAGIGALATVFACASVLTVILQWPIARLMRRAGAKVALPLGFALQAAGFGSLAVMAVLSPPDGFPILPALLLITGLSLGHMCVTPVAMGLVVEYSAGRPTGAFYGLLASAGGVAVLLGNTALAPLYELAYTPSVTAAAPWVLLTLLAGISAAAINRFLPKTKVLRSPVQA